MNFWASTPQQAEGEDNQVLPSVPPPLPIPTETPRAEEEETQVAEPCRDEVIDPSRGDQEGESRDEEKIDNHQRHIECVEQNVPDVSMFSTLTQLLFNPFSDGYCQTPFCSDTDYLPPMCPSTGFYSFPKRSNPKLSAVSPIPQPIVPKEEYQGCDTFGDICRSSSGNSSSPSNAKRRRQRPLAFAVGHWDDWKDIQGRRVVITRSKASVRPPQACTCSKGPESIPGNLHRDPNNSPHQTKAVMCKQCRLVQDLEVPASHSSGSCSSHSHIPLI